MIAEARPAPPDRSIAAGPRTRALRAPVLTATGFLAAGGVLVVRSPYSSGSYGYCPFRALTGLWCPGCGGLRAAHDLMTFDLAAAWGMNALLVLAVPVLAALWIRWVRHAWRGRPVAVVTVRGAAVLAVVLAVFTVGRNLPGVEPLLGA